MTVFGEVFKGGRLGLGNSASERGIEDGVIGRRNWMLANTSKEADFTLMHYSLIRTAVENGRNPAMYLTRT